MLLHTVTQRTHLLAHNLAEMEFLIQEKSVIMTSKIIQMDAMVLVKLPLAALVLLTLVLQVYVLFVEMEKSQHLKFVMMEIHLMEMDVLLIAQWLKPDSIVVLLELASKVLP